METTIQQPRTLTNYEIESLARAIRVAIGNSLDSHNTQLRTQINNNSVSLVKDHNLYNQMIAKSKEQQALIDAHMAEINKATSYIRLLKEDNPFLAKIVDDSWRISLSEKEVDNIYQQIADSVKSRVAEKEYLANKLVIPYNLQGLIESDLILKNSEGKVIRQDIEKYVEDYTLRFVTSGDSGELEIITEDEGSDYDIESDEDEDEW